MATPIITHSKVSGKAAGTDSTRVYGTHWDANHVVTGLENVDNTSDASKNAAVATLTNKTLTDPLISRVYGGAAAGSTVTIQSTNNGSPSGDVANIYGSTITIANPGGGASTINLGRAGGSGAQLVIAGSTSGSTLLQTNGVASGTITLPAATDTLVGKATTDTLTNKTLTSPAITTPTGIVKGDVGLGNVDNTSDANKPVSTAQAAAIVTAVGGAWINSRLAKTANYTVLNADKGKTLALGGTAWFTLTFGAASGYDANFSVMVINEDTTRAKWIAPNGLTGFYLWPGQSVLVYNSNNVWQTLGRSRWKTPASTLNLYTDFTNGNDANDGLAAGSGNAKKTVQAALDQALNEFDFTSWAGLVNEPSGPTLLVINMAASTTDTQGVHFAAHAFVGAQGGAQVKILGGVGSKITTTGTDALGFFCNVQVQISNVELSTVTSGNCITSDLGAQVYVLSGVTFGACAGSHMSVNNGGRIYISNNYTVSGNAATAHILGQGAAGYVSGNTITVTVTASITLGYWVLTSNMAASSLVAFTFSLGAFTVTAKRYEADAMSLINTNGGGINYFPGNAAGSTSGGGQYV